MVVPSAVIVLAGSRDRHPAEQHSANETRGDGAIVVPRMPVMVRRPVVRRPVMRRPVMRGPVVRRSHAMSRSMAGMPPQVDIRDRIGH